MNLKDFQVTSEADDTYHLRHPSGKTFTVEKKGLSPKAMKQIQSLCSGGGVQKMADGGTSVPAYLMPNDPNANPDILSNALASNPNAPPPEPEPLMNRVGNYVGDAASNALSTTADAVGRVASPVIDFGKGLVGSSSKAEDPSAAANPAINRSSQSAMSTPPDGGAQAHNPFSQRGMEMESALNKQEGGIRNYMNEMGSAGKNTQAAYQDFINQQSQMQTPDQVMASYKQKDDQLMQHFMDAKVDPNRYLNNMSTGSKILSFIGMALSGMGGGASGKNLAMDNINKAIDHDIEAQKNDQGKAMNLWKMNREQSKDEMQAHLMTQNQLLTGVQAKVAMAGAQTQNIEARFRGTELINQIEQQKAQNRFQLGLMSGGGNMDPAQLVSTLVPKEHQAQAFKEIGAAQNTARMGDTIMKSFEDAAKENTVMKTGAGYFRTPGSVHALHQAMQPTFADLEGTVRQAAMDNTFQNVTPMPGDSEHKIQQKRASLREYLQSKASAPTAKGYGIDLSRFSSTATDPVARLNPQEQTYYQWAKANPSSPVAVAFMKKKGFQ